MAGTTGSARPAYAARAARVRGLRPPGAQATPLRRGRRDGTATGGAVLTAVVVALLALVAACTEPTAGSGTGPAAGTAPGTGPASGAAPASDPPPPRNAVLRPSFDTTEGEIDAGSAFVARWTDGRLLLLTAQHLFGEAGGMSRDYTGAELAGVVSGVTATSVDEDAVVVRSTARVNLPEAVPLTTDITRDLAAFEVTDAAGVTVLELATAAPAAGERVYLLAEVSGSERRLFPATVEDVAPEKYLQYAFADAIDLTATSGAPVLNARGEVVGMNVGADEDGTRPRGLGNSIATIRPMLANHL